MKRKMKAQGSIELMIIAPVMIFFIYVLYLNGVRLHAVLTAANTNYSDGIAIVRSQTDTHADINASNYVLNRNNRSNTPPILREYQSYYCVRMDAALYGWDGSMQTTTGARRESL